MVIPSQPHPNGDSTGRVRRRSRAPVAVCWLLSGLALLAGCGLGGRDVARRPGSALWLDSASGPVSAEELERLASLGVEQIFLEVGEVASEGGEVGIRSGWRDLQIPERRPVTLVVGGRVPSVEPSDEAVRALAGELEQLRLEARRRGVLHSGWHLDWQPSQGSAGGAGDGLDLYAGWVSALSSEVEGEIPWSATLPRPLLGAGSASDLARAADALLVFLYGQRPREQEDSDAWELATVEENLRRLEELGEDYLVGVATLGRLQRQGEPGGATTLAGLRRLLDQRGLETTFGFSLEGIDRRVYTFEARAPLRFGPWRLERGERLAASLLGAEHVERLLERLGSLPLEHHLGQVWYRPPRPEEGLALTVANLIGALAPGTSEPHILARRSERGDRRLQVRLTNAGTRASDLVRMDDNYLQLTLPRGRFVSAEIGDFQRYDLLDSRTGRRSLRNPDVVRFFLPFFDAGETVATGEVVVAGARAEEAVVGGSFRLPDGTRVEVVEAGPETAGDEER